MGIFDFWKTKPSPALPPGRELPAVGEDRKIKLGIIVGHEKKAPGATMAPPYNTSEYEFNSGVADLMRMESIRCGKIIPVVIFRDGIGIKGAYKKAEEEKCDCVIELHFNAYNGSADGSETLCTTDADDVDFANIVQRAVCGVFDRQGSSRGIKCLSRTGRGGENIYSFPNGTNCLVEPFFGDNPREAQLAKARKGDYAVALVNAVLVWARRKDLIH